MRLITPKRLKENEAFLWNLADRQLDEFVDNGRCEFISEFAGPLALLVIADLLGVPESDHEKFRNELGPKRAGQALGSTGGQEMKRNPLEFLYQQFSAYVEEKRRSPSDDVLTGLATATFPDGSMPEVIDVVRVAANVFAAGQETTVRLLANGMQVLGEQPDLQARLRVERDLVPNFVEETLRYESPVKGDFRMARTATTVGGVDISPGTTVMVLNAAANRDVRRFSEPAVFDVDRANARQHIAFGHGAHTCPGAPLARAEGIVSIERILDRTRDLRLSEEHHGPAGARRFPYEPTWVLRGLSELHIEFTPVDAPA
jgi:cytochrome P450